MVEGRKLRRYNKKTGKSELVDVNDIRKPGYTFEQMKKMEERELEYITNALLRQSYQFALFEETEDDVKFLYGMIGDASRLANRKISKVADGANMQNIIICQIYDPEISVFGDEEKIREILLERQKTRKLSPWEIIGSINPLCNEKVKK